MALEDYQTAIVVSKKYHINLKVNSGLGENLKPRITVIGGTVTVYVSEEEPANLAAMVAVEETVGMLAFESIPRYLAVVQDGGTVSSVVLTGIDAVDLGAIA
jgi:hypothetical protein